MRDASRLAGEASLSMRLLGVERIDMTTLLIFLGGLAVLMSMGYLAACAGAGRWLPLREWLTITTCNHTHGRLVAIEFDGEAIYECARCGKYIGKPLRNRGGDIGAGSGD